MKRTLLLALALIMVFSPTVFTQPTDATVEGADPYEEEEFPAWALTLRRAEVVLFGSLPFTFLFSRTLYGFGRYALVSLQAGSSVPEYLPPLFAPAGGVGYDSDDQLYIALGALGLSFGVALIDYLLGLMSPEATVP